MPLPQGLFIFYEIGGAGGIWGGVTWNIFVMLKDGICTILKKYILTEIHKYNRFKNLLKKFLLLLITLPRLISTILKQESFNKPTKFSFYLVT